MTCIVSIEHDDVVWMGGDSLAVDDTGDYHLCARPKVFVRGELLFGCTGGFRQQQVLEHAFVIPPLPGSFADRSGLDAWMCAEFAPAARETLRKAGVLSLKDGQEACSNFLVGLRGKTYQVESDFGAIRNTRGYDAIGCGAKYALGSLHTTEALGKSDPGLRINAALMAAEALNNGVRRPFTILEGAR